MTAGPRSVTWCLHLISDLFDAVVENVKVSVVGAEAHEVDLLDWLSVLHFQEWLWFIVIGEDADGTGWKGTKPNRKWIPCHWMCLMSFVLPLVTSTMILTGRVSAKILNSFTLAKTWLFLRIKLRLFPHPPITVRTNGWYLIKVNVDSRFLSYWFRTSPWNRR